MSFRYVNPGYVYLLDSNVTATQITDSTYSKTGVAFTQTNSSAGVTIPQFAEGDEFWAKFDVYIPSTVSEGFDITCYIPRANSYGIRINIKKDPRISIRAIASGSAVYKSFVNDQLNVAEYGIKLGGITTILMHLVTGDRTTAHIDLNVGGVEFFSGVENGAINYSNNYNAVARLYATDDAVKFSNVIFSDTEISPKEQVIALPISATATNMTAGAGGMYTATTAGQTLLQTPDITALAQQFSGESKITGIQVVGNPAYKTSTGLETMIGLSKSGNVTTEHGSYTLGTDSTALVMDGWGLSGVTLSDLPNMQFGWKTAD